MSCDLFSNTMESFIEQLPGGSSDQQKQLRNQIKLLKKNEQFRAVSWWVAVFIGAAMVYMATAGIVSSVGELTTGGSTDKSLMSSNVMQECKEASCGGGDVSGFLQKRKAVCAVASVAVGFGGVLAPLLVMAPRVGNMSDLENTTLKDIKLVEWTYNVESPNSLLNCQGWTNAETPKDAINKLSKDKTPWETDIVLKIHLNSSYRKHLGGYFTEGKKGKVQEAIEMLRAIDPEYRQDVARSRARGRAKALRKRINDTQHVRGENLNYTVMGFDSDTGETIKRFH